MSRLSSQTLAQLPADVIRPAYDRAAVKCGVVHIGIGAFHRAHQAVIFDNALNAGDLRWGIVAASLRSPGVRDQMQPQDGLYTMLVRDGAAQRARVIGAVQRIIVAPEEPQALLAALASPDTHIVTLTITEKGYKLDPATGALIEADPQLAVDMVSLDAPQTAPGYLVAALARRRAAGLSPFTAISCDNLPHNGARLRGAVLELARRHDAALADWIAQHGAFPETMVDRIVPATTAEDIAALATRLGVEDQAMVKTEPFLQWVIEDRFCGPRPNFGAGVQLTAAVAPWEEAKLRLLNGAHSGIAYLGGLAGIDHVHEVLALPEARHFVEALWDEAERTLSPPPELDVAAYRRDLMARFDNPTLRHRTRQIAMDGSQKLPQRLLAPIAARLKAGDGIDALALAVAAWIRWQAGRDDSGAPHYVDDPLAETMAAALADKQDTADRVAAILAFDAVVPPALARDDRLRTSLDPWLAILETNGALAALAAFRGVME
ncbi:MULTISPECIES: mannitol dehydrogenase family protein [Sphingobium]|uniref:Mannitol dehydrogenase family protein n=1 Tax=Sphingobium cupriresistens TaxID=1132417 RepID=A0A8G2DVQ4_9SPHN|nr:MULTISPECIES: mannitol dehydrogenase family protein [Sphingobium]MBJ7376266.1 mannitol dehydrogenase family protein [Sphingobium sp.]RYM10908.1 mannitol dehydrogenase family protein [Sphingobium cupriresistens]